MSDRACRMAAVVLALAVVGAGLHWGAKTVGGADSYGYASQAELWLEGRLVEPAPWIGQVPWPSAQLAFLPLGWVHMGREPVIVPQYAAGLPLVMAAFKAVAGHCAIFWVSPLAGGLLVYFTFAVGWRVIGAPVGLVAAWLVATSPAFLLALFQPMSDVPVSAAWIATIVLLQRATTATAVGAGLAASLAIMIRPNLVPMLVPLTLWLFADAMAAAGDARRRALGRLVLFVAAAMPGIAAIAAIHQVRYGSPLKSGYEPMSTLYTWSNVGANAVRYATWFIQTQTLVALAGLVALVLPIRALWPSPASRRFLIAGTGALAFLCLQYFTYFVFEDWSYLRFFLPVWPLIMIGCATALLRAGGVLGARLGTLAVAAACLVVGAATLRAADADSAFETAAKESRYAKVGEIVRKTIEPGSLVISHQHSGSIRYYGGRLTMNMLSLDEQWLDKGVAWLAERGIKTYVVLDDWELPMFRGRFEPQNQLGRLAMPPDAMFLGPTITYVYDLSRAQDGAATMRWPDRDFEAGCVRPQPKPVLRLTDPPRR